MAHHAEAPDSPGVNASWGQRLGNGVAVVTLLTAAGAVYALRFRHEPAPPPHADATAEKHGYCLGVVADSGPVVAPTDPSPAVIARYAGDGHSVAPFSRCGRMESGRATAKPGSTLLLIDSTGERARNARQ